MQRSVCVCVLCHRLYRWDNNLYWHESTASASCTCLLIFWIVGTKFYNNREHVNSSLRKICKKKKKKKEKGESERRNEGEEGLFTPQDLTLHSESPHSPLARHHHRFWSLLYWTAAWSWTTLQMIRLDIRRSHDVCRQRPQNTVQSPFSNCAFGV